MRHSIVRFGTPFEGDTKTFDIVVPLAHLQDRPPIPLSLSHLPVVQIEVWKTEDHWLIVGECDSALEVDSILQHLVGELPNTSSVRPHIFRRSEQLKEPIGWPLKMVGVLSENYQPAVNSQGDGVLVGHPDAGYLAHECLPESRYLITNGFDFVAGRVGLASNESSEHGLSTASVLLGAWQKDEDGRIYGGVAPKAKAIPYRVVDLEFGEISEVVLSDREAGYLAEAIMLALLEGVEVVSISLGRLSRHAQLERALRQAYERDIIVCVASSNIIRVISYPASSPYTIACAAVDVHGMPWTGSGHIRLRRGDAGVDISAPGYSVPNASPGNQYTPSTGTSFSAAITAGACALWLDTIRTTQPGEFERLQKAGVRRADVFRWALRRSATPFREENLAFGPGILNVPSLLNVQLSEYPIPSDNQIVSLVQAASTAEDTEELAYQVRLCMPIDCAPAPVDGIASVQSLLVETSMLVVATLSYISVLCIRATLNKKESGLLLDARTEPPTLTIMPNLPRGSLVLIKPSSEVVTHQFESVNDDDFLKLLRQWLPSSSEPL